MKNIEDYLSMINSEKGEAIDNFCIIEKDIKHLL
jgi:hypothetical protein